MRLSSNGISGEESIVDLTLHQSLYVGEQRDPFVRLEDKEFHFDFPDFIHKNTLLVEKPGIGNSQTSIDVPEKFVVICENDGLYKFTFTVTNTDTSEIKFVDSITVTDTCSSLNRSEITTATPTTTAIPTTTNTPVLESEVPLATPEATLQVLSKSDMQEGTPGGDSLDFLTLGLILIASLAAFILGFSIKSKRTVPETADKSSEMLEDSEQAFESKPEERPVRPTIRSESTKTTEIKASSISDPVIGEPSTFRSVPWWQSDWWNLDPKGHNGDVTCDFGNFEDISIIGASIRGDDHRYDGTRCDDSFYFVRGETSDDKNFIVACVCDGVGQSKYSSYSSKLSSYLFTRKLASTIKNLDFDHVKQKANSSLSFTIEKVAEWSPDSTFLAPPQKSTEVPASELQTTLTFAVIQTSTSDKEGSTVFHGNIGDSPIFLLREGTFTKLEDNETTDEDHSTEIVDSSTQGIFTTKEFNFFETKLPVKSALALVTDGVGNFLTFNDQILPVGKYLGETWQSPLEGSRFVSSLMFDFRTATDDRTAVVCWLNPKD